MRPIATATIAATLLAVPESMASYIPLDSFDATPNTGLGGTREIITSAFSDPFGFGFDSGVDTSGEGLFYFNAGAGVIGGAGLRYGTLDGPLNLDLTAFDADGFSIRVFEADQAFEGSIQIRDGGGSLLALERYQIEAGSFQTFTVKLADFDIVNPGFDATDVDQIWFGFGDQFNDTAIDFVLEGVGLSVVPAPASLALLGLGGLVARRKR